MSFLIYLLTNLINNKIYVGQTIQPIKKRIHQHNAEARRFAKGHKVWSHLHAAMAKYGIENFKPEVIDTADYLEEMNEKECLWIKRLHSDDRRIGYNLEKGGNGLGRVSEETKLKISMTLKGRKHSPEHTKKCADARRGKPVSEETRKRLSLMQKGVKRSKEHILAIVRGHTGLKLTEATKRKISEATKGKKRSEETKRKISGENNHGAKCTKELVDQLRKEHETTNITISALARKYNLVRTTVSQIVRYKSWVRF